MIKYSIVVPAFNMERYIEECIQSIVAQKRDDIEIIIINDGSSDNTLKICKSLKNLYPYIQLIDKKNTGSMDSYIIGVKKCIGEYICFLDSDDILSNVYFEKLDDAIINSNKADIVMFDFFKFTKSKEYRSKVNSIEYGFVDNRVLNDLRNDYFSNYEKYSLYRWNKIYKNSLLQNIVNKLDYRITYFEDLHISLMLLNDAKSVYYMNNELYGYRLRKSSVTHTVKKKVFEDNRLMKQKLEFYFYQKGFNKNALNSMYEYMDYGYIRYYLKSKEKPKRIKVNKYMFNNNEHKSHIKLIFFYMFRIDFVYKLLNFLRNVKNKNDDLFE